jgi:hypothetical protein
LAEKGEELRQTHKEELALEREQAGLEPIGKGLRIRQLQENQRRDHRIIKSVTKSSNRQPLSHVQEIIIEATTGKETVITHSTKHAIEQCCLEEDEARFHQADDRLLQHPEVIRILGTNGCSDSATLMLQTGNVPDELKQLDPLMEMYLKAHHVQHAIPEIPA